ncbi:MAG: 4-alpha-glucanotransferase [Candidatus Hodarchaeales archaeon]|jgi:4-alpha-glucanotransferase
MKSNANTDPLQQKETFLQYRMGGILLHPTSLPGNYGIGDLGPELFRFLNFLSKNHQQLWQILPIGPTGYGNSPYQSFSAFAGNPFLISPEKLVSIGILTQDEIIPFKFNKSTVDYGRIIDFKWKLLHRAHRNFGKIGNSSLHIRLRSFSEKHHSWLENFALFMSIKEAHDFKPWNQWKEALKSRKQEAISSWKKEYKQEIEFQKFTQFIFFQQWEEVCNYARSKNIRIIGDIPIFVAYDSADVWANPHLFYLDERGDMLFVAGVPPDYFSETGQRWGNPLYRWKKMKKNGYKWWVNRIKHSFSLVDFLRIDHFRGFESYWQIPAQELTAVHGEWVLGPGIELFITLKKELGFLPIIAENLGIITPAVDELLQQTGFPGMRVLQFAFGFEEEEGIENQYLPHNFIPNSVVYTGTHDNDTLLGWFSEASHEIQKEVLDYLNSDGEDISKDLIRLAWSSVAKMCITPLQDLLRLGTEGRMNFPGTESGNWEWRYTWDQLTPEKGKELALLSKIYQRETPLK